MTITVYTLPRCVQCDATKRWLDDRNVHYNSVDLRTDPVAKQKIDALGFRSAPVIEADGHDPWSGFDPAKLAALV